MTALAQPLTLETAFRLIAELQALVAEQAKTIKAQAKIIRVQAKTIAKLEEKLRKDSSNSSKPPSSDGPGKKRIYPPRKPSGRKQGAQPGHKKHERTLLPVEMARSVTDVRPPSCERCGEKLQGEDPDPKRHQIIDLPPIVPIVDEWRMHARTCRRASCGHRTQAQLPEGVSTLGYGPGVDAMVGQVAGEMRASKRTTAETMTGLLSVPMSVGAVVDSTNRLSAALKEPCDIAVEFAKKQPIKNADESGWKEKLVKGYIWTCVTAFVTVFIIQPSRSAEAAATLLGTVMGILGTDRYVGYAWWPVGKRQVCWAHLIRDFVAIAQRGGSSQVLGDALLAEAARMFAWWKRLKEGDLSRTTFQVYMRSVRKRVEELLLQGCSDTHSKTAGTCKEMWKIREAFWTFARIEGVEPTNNAAEQALRFAVLWRKMCYGTKSTTGSEFVARILTVHATLRKQGRNVHAFLREACEAKRSGKAPPSLLPRVNP